MKILIVDDNNNRVAQVVGYLADSKNVSREDVSRAGCAQEALTLLQREKFDLLLVDLMIPHRLDDSPSISSSLHLLAEVTNSDGVMRPRKIVGLTAYDEAEENAAGAFHGLAWIIVKTSEMSDAWLETIGGCVEYVRREMSQVEVATYKTDLLVLTALQSELDAVHRLPWNWQPAEPADDSTFTVRGSFEVGGRTIRVVSAHAERMGMVSTAVMASKLIAIYRPRICAMPGICAGVPGRAQMGDVVFADQVWDYQCGKLVVDKEQVSGFEMEPHQLSVESSILSRADQLAKDTTALNALWNSWPASKPTNPFKILRGPMASGSAVLADASVTAKIVAQNRKTRAIEMEAYGLLLASGHADRPRPIAFVAKSVCDFADESKSDDFQSYCCDVSAKVLRLFMERFVIDMA